RNSASPDTVRESSMTIVALLSGIVTGSGRSYRVEPPSTATAASDVRFLGAEIAALEGSITGDGIGTAARIAAGGAIERATPCATLRFLSLAAFGEAAP